MKLKTAWQSEAPLPDEEYLKKVWQAELQNLEGAFATEGEGMQRQQANIIPLVKASSLDTRAIDKKIEEVKFISRYSLRRAQAQISTPPVDIEALHKQDLELAEANASRMESPGNPHWQGHIWNPSYCGWWSSWNGEAEESPSQTCNSGAKRFDPRTQAWGEGWFDGDYSELHGYLAFQFSPPSWGHLHIYVYPWFHGYYSLFSDDAWYNSEYTRAEVDSWVDVHQNFWRSRQYQRRFTLTGSELHPTRYGRIDAQYTQAYYMNVGAGDTVTIRAGGRLYSYARAGGSHSVLNFQAGSANYIYVPYVYWYLHQ